MEILPQPKNYIGHFASMSLYPAAMGFSVFILYSYGRVDLRPPLLDLVVLTFATFRLIHLFTYDKVSDFLRDYFARSDNGLRKTISEILDCPWCSGVWLAWLVGFLYLLSPVFWYPLFFVALAGAGSILQVIGTYLLRLTPKKES